MERSPLTSERAVHGFGVSLYDAIVPSAKNAELLSAKDPADIHIEECEGNWWSQNSVMRVCDWLNAVRDVSTSSGTFESQVLEPVRVSARYLSSVRRLPKPTADVDVWVLGVSRPYRYERYGEDKVTVFAVVPELESVMRARLDAGCGVSAGPCRMGCVQPIPMVNRLHPSRPSLAKGGWRPDLAGWSFLKTGFGDQDLPGSAETEGFFEAESAQSEQRHHLGSAFVLACKIADICAPNIVVQSVLGKERATMALSEDLAASADRGGLSEGRYARVLAVRWYGEGGKLPEVFMADPAVSERDALADEITGYVRARGSVPVEELKERYGRADLAGPAALSVNKGTVSYAYNLSAPDPVADAFLKSAARLRELRARFRTGGSTGVGWSDVLDEVRMSARGMARLLKTRTQLRDVLACVQTRIDCTGKGATEDQIADAPGMEQESAKRMLRRLKYLGLAEKRDGLIWSAGAARGALAEAFSEHVRKIESDIVSVPELGGDVPQSVVVSRLSRPDSGFVPLQDVGRANRLYWVRKGAGRPAVLEAEEKLRKLRADVLGIARGVSFPVTAEYVAQEAENAGLPVSHLVANLAAESLVRAGKFLPSGQSWEYPVAERVADFLANAAGEFTVDEILSEAHIAGRDRDLVSGALASLAGAGRAAKLSDGIWSCGGGDERILPHYVEKIKRRALALLRSRRNGMDKGALIGHLRRFVLDIDSERRLPDPAAAITSALAEMEADNLVSGADGVCRAR